MAENYGSLEGVLDANETLEGEIDSHDEMSGEIQFSGGVGGVKDVQVNNESVVDADKVAHIDLTPYAEKENVYDKQTIDTALEGKADTDDIPTDLADLQDDSDHRLVTDTEKEEWSGKSNVSANPQTTTETLTGLEIDGTGYAVPSGGGGDVTDVKVDGTSVVDPVTKEANIDLTDYAKTEDIPTDLADLSDDATHRLVTDTEKSTWDNKADVSDIPTVNNPTITIQKNGQNIDTFSLNQTANKVIDISVPTKTSDLQNDSSFITNTVNNLANYYLKSDTYTQTEVNNLISAAVNGRFEKVTTLPASGEPNVIYLVPKTTALTNNVYDEYIWQDNAWELLGSTEIDLSNYVTTTDLSTALADYVTSSTFNTTIANYYTKTEVGNLLDGKVDKVSGKGLSTYDYDATAKGIVDNVTTNLAGKVDKVNGKGLSTEDYTTTEKNKLAGISTGANKVESSTTNGNIRIDGTETQVYDGSGKVDKVNGKGLSTNDYDNTDKAKVDKINTTTTSISGNPISISGLKANQLAINPIITLEPIQDLHGQSKPYPAGGGKNKFAYTVESIKAANTAGTWSGNVYTLNNITFTILTDIANNVIGINVNSTQGASADTNFQVAPAGTVVLTPSVEYKFNGHISSAGSTSTWRMGLGIFGYVYSESDEKTGSVDAGYNGNCFITVFSGAKPNNVKFYPMIRLATETDATFAPPSNISPISGYDKVEVLSCGKNLFNKTRVELGQINQTTGEDESASNIYRYKGYIYLKPNTKYTIGKNNGQTLRVFFYSQNGYLNSSTYTGTVTTFDTGNTIRRIRFQSADFNTIKEILQVEEGTSASTIYPYNKSTSISESLGQTVYGGTLDVRTGKFTVTKQIADLGDFTYTYNSQYQYFYTEISSMADLGYGLSDRYQITTASYDGNQPDNSFKMSGTGNKRMFITNRAYNNATTFKTAMVGAKVVYELATPFYIQLTPHEIPLLKDYAYVSTNGTNIALDYHNGELASLADVSQLGETVNELGDYVGRNNAYNYVDLTSTSYEFPNDGYIVVDSQAATSGAVRVQLTGYNGSFVIGGIYMNITGAYQIQSTFVKKGMRARVIQDVTGVRKRYVPLV